MDIPLKSKPKVSIAEHLDASLFAEPLVHRDPRNRRYRPHSISRVPTSQQLADSPNAPDGETTNYKLTRTYSETETNNFDADTGHRLFDDGKIRAKPLRVASPRRPEFYDQSSSRSSWQLYSRSHEPAMDSAGSAFAGLEDEYVPDLDFAAVVSQWNRPASDASSPVSRDTLFLDLNQLHAQLAPQPIQFRNPQYANTLQFTIAPDSAEDPQKPKIGASPKNVGASNFEAVLASLPSNFNEFPYSQRKKLVQLVSKTIDYSQFSQFAKSYFTDKLSMNLSAKTFRSDPASVGRNGSLTRRSRRNSANTVAGRLLALSLSLSLDLKKLDKVAKYDIDEKGAYVLDHQLGKVIGFGAWGIIRECTAIDGTLRAVKIVKATKELDRSQIRNPKVLQIFRKEIAIWQQLHHPNILPLLNSLETDEIIFCLTRRITGGTLFDLVTRWGIFNESFEDTHGPILFSIERQTKRIKNTIEFVRQIVQTLTYMHEELGIVHGDLKLENCLVDDLNPDDIRIILCDFGMSRVFTTRTKRELTSLKEESVPKARSQSSFASTRRPYHGPDSVNTKKLFSDDCKIGILQLLRTQGPSVNSVSQSGNNSSSSLANFHEFKTKDNRLAEIDDVDLPHLHIGLLPYAAHVLLQPKPPPLGPSADIWALGVLIFTMAVGKLPFQHPYEPRLRCMIASGKFDRCVMKRACLLKWLLNDEPKSIETMVDMKRRAEMESLRKEWELLKHSRFQWVDDLVTGCLYKDITKRLDLHTIASTFVTH